VTERARLAPFVVTLAGTEGAVRDGLSQVLRALVPLGLGADTLGTVELVLAEVLNNVIEHALAGAVSPPPIEVRGHQTKRGLHLTVIDRGTPMPDTKAPVGRVPDLGVPLADMPEGGFGWFLVRTLAQDIRYTRVDGINHLDLVLPL